MNAYETYRGMGIVPFTVLLGEDILKCMPYGMAAGVFDDSGAK